MSIYVCIDDTDNIESIGTGEVAERIRKAIHQSLSLASSLITRHQLLIHEDIPYTSHNSSMCFELPMGEKKDLDPVIQIAKETILTSMAEGSDPGLCVLCNPDQETTKSLIDFGKSAKKEVLSKKKAYDLATKLKIHLSEHGGTGDGIIGALSGIGLRLSGNDGEVKGGLKDIQEGLYEVEALLGRDDVTRIYDLTSGECVLQGQVHFKKRSKTILREGQFTLLVGKTKTKKVYQAIGKRIIRQMETKGQEYIIEDILDIQGIQNIQDIQLKDCHKFEADVAEEQLDNQAACKNCRHRRWEAKGIQCMKGL